MSADVNARTGGYAQVFPDALVNSRGFQGDAAAQDTGAELKLAAVATGGATPGAPGAPGTAATPATPPSHGGNGGSSGNSPGPALTDGGKDTKTLTGKDSGGSSSRNRIPDALVTPGGQPEVVITVPASEAGRISALAPRIGLKVLRQRALGRLGLSMLVVQKPAFQSIDALRDRLKQERLSATADYNALYRPAGDARVYANQMVTPRHVGSCRLDRPMRIGVVDGMVDLDHPALKGAKVSVDVPTTIGTGIASEHATDVIALIAAQPGAGRIAGLLPQAEIFAAGAVKTHRGQQTASVDDIAAALNWMAQRRVAVINMSLAGPANAVLGAVIGRIAQFGTLMVAAVGNDQQGTVSYPASDPNVFGVTAVDVRKRRYSKANYGPGVAFAAPGVDLYLPTREGHAYRSGTSYASAVAAAVIALEIADGRRSRDEVAKDLAGRAEDLGPPGRDRLFGWGLIRAEKCNSF